MNDIPVYIKSKFISPLLFILLTLLSKVVIVEYNVPLFISLTNKVFSCGIFISFVYNQILTF